MATIIKKRKYRCSDDCEQSGCPEHEAEFMFQTASMVMSFKDGNGGEIWFDTNSLEALESMIAEVREYRSDL